MEKIQSQLTDLGHEVFMPVRVDGVNYWSEDGASRVKAKKGLDLMSEHMGKIEKSDAILVINITKRNIENYIGANTFLEIGFAHYRIKKIYLLNSAPNQEYISDEILTVEPVAINGDLTQIS